MNSRLQALVDKGYSYDDVLRLASFTEEELNYAAQRAFEHITHNCNKTSNPIVIYIGGQPGSGKTILSMQLKNSLTDFVEIGIDNYRMYHPRYLEIENYIRNFWKDKTESINDTPGNDIANFTHLFAGEMTDRLTDMCSRIDENGKSYSIIFEWGMREPTGPLKTMEQLKKIGYNNIVLFMGTPSSLSYDACNLRADIMKNSKRIYRKVPKDFHDFCVQTLPNSIEVIYHDGYDKGSVDYMAIVSREGKILWDCNYKEKPGEIYKNCLQSAEIININDSMKALAGNDREAIGLIDDKEKLMELRENFVLLAPSLFAVDAKKRNQ